MSRETVRQAIRNAIHGHGDDDVARGHVFCSCEFECAAIEVSLGIDPDLPLDTLRRRLLWGERVEQAESMTYKAMGKIVVGEDWNKHLEPHKNAANGADAFHRWLTRDDQENDR